MLYIQINDKGNITFCECLFSYGWKSQNRLEECKREMERESVWMFEWSGVCACHLLIEQYWLREYSVGMCAASLRSQALELTVPGSALMCFPHI